MATMSDIIFRVQSGLPTKETVPTTNISFCQPNSNFLVCLQFTFAITHFCTITVDILTMHNASPQLFLCIVTFYARRNVSQSMIICDLCQKCHTSKIIGKNWEVPHIYMVSTFMRERLLLKKELREVCLTEFT